VKGRGGLKVNICFTSERDGSSPPLLIF